MRMRQPEHERVLRPRHRIGETILEQLFAALRHFHVLRLLDTERELRQVAPAKPVFEIRLDRVLFWLLGHASQTG